MILFVRLLEGYGGQMIACCLLCWCGHQTLANGAKQTLLHQMVPIQMPLLALNQALRDKTCLLWLIDESR